MSSIIYAGHDFSGLCCAEVVARSANPIVAEALDVPGRAGALLVSGSLPPAEVTVRLFLDVGFSADDVRMAEIRHTLSFWLCAPGGGELVLPDEPEHAYRDALLVSAGAWSKLFSDGQCEVVFALFDPIAYGRERVVAARSFDVGGTWPTLPEFACMAAAGSRVSVGCPALGRAVVVERSFSGGEAVAIDCAGERVWVDGIDARADVALGSDFFALEPGGCELSVSGCSSFEARFRERWV